MKFVAVFLACIVAAQAYNPSGFEDIKVDGLMKDNSGFMGGKSMGGKSMGGQTGWMGGKSMGGKSMGGQTGWMGGKSMGGNSGWMGKSTRGKSMDKMDKWMDDFMKMDDMSMGKKSMGGKSGWSAVPNYNHGYQPSGKSGYAAVPNYNHGYNPSGKSGYAAVPNYNHGYQPSGKSGWSAVPSYNHEYHPASGKSGYAAVPNYNHGYHPSGKSGFAAVPSYNHGYHPSGKSGFSAVPAYNHGITPSGKSSFDSPPLVPSGEISGTDTGFAAVPTVHHEPANPFACPSYQYWACHQFHVMPPKNLYCYTIHFNRAWCTTQHYCDILVEYPKCLDKKTCEEEKTDIDAIIAGLTTKLAEARTTIETEITKNRDTFTTQIETVHAEYVKALKDYLKRCYSPDSYTYTQKVACYEAELAGARIHAVNNLETAVRNAMSRIEVFHAQLLARFRSCLTKRSEAIKTYNHKIDHTATCYVTRYRTKLEEVKTKKTAFITCIFERLYAGKDKPEQFAEFLKHFKTELETQLEADVEAFQTQINTFLVEIKENYRCGYKCFFSTFSKDFTKKTFSKSGSKFPSMPKADCKLVAVGPFLVDWKACEIKNLKTLSADEKECKFDEKVHLDAIAASVTHHQAELAAKIALWKTQTDAWEHTATVTLNHRVNCLVPKSYCGHVPSQAEIDACRSAAEIRAKSWIAAQKGKLLAHIETVQKTVTAQIDAWKSHAEKHVANVKAAFEECVSTKSSKITAYTELLEKTKTTQRAALEAKLEACVKSHKAQFEAFWEASFGTKQTDAIVVAMKTSYLACVDDHVTKVLAKFDAWWAEFTPKLIEHHTCGLKCKANVCTPNLRLCYNWTWCAPAISGFHFYC